MKINKQQLLLLFASFSLLFLLVFSISQLSQKQKFNQLYEIDNTNKQIGKYKNQIIKNEENVIVRHYPNTEYKLLNQIIKETQDNNINLDAKEIKQDYEINKLFDRYIIVTLMDYEDEVNTIKKNINFDIKENELVSPSNLFNDKALRYIKYKGLSEDEISLLESEIQIGSHLITENELPKYIKNDYGEIKVGKSETLPSVYLGHTINPDTKMIAITFDDGPHQTNTERIIEISKKYDAHITFFMLGLNIERYPELVKLALDEGHQIASHSYNHKNFTEISHDAVEFQINHTNNLLNEVTGNDVQWMIRPPYGAYNKDILTNFPLIYVNWTVDTKDWLYKDTQTVCNSIVDSAFDGAIVLLHDIYETSVEGFECGIEKLSAQGYQFVTIQDMFKAKNIPLEKGKLYRSATQ